MPDGIDFAKLPNWCVFTETDVVRRALDAVGWVEHADLSACRILEPTAGDGAFVSEAVRRLLASMRARGLPLSWENLKDRLLAFEFEPLIAAALRSNVSSVLAEAGIADGVRERLVRHWCLEGDFLAAAPPSGFSHSVGNPPFRRGGGAGADACVAFLEKAFSLLRGGGRMAMLAPISLASAAGAKHMRHAVMRDGRVESLESYEPGRAFARRVSARSALYVFSRAAVMEAGPAVCDGPWLAGSADARAAFASAAERLPTLEQAGCRVRLGMATGRNSIFVRPIDEFDVEGDLLVPAVGTRDLAPPEVRWLGLHVLDTSASDGRPWTREEKPRLHAFLSRHRTELQARHSVAVGGSWRATHTRLDRGLALAPKVLVAETAKPCRVALDPGGHMPLNSVHAVTSDEWPLAPLQAILSTAAVGLVANALLLHRGGGYLRVNATALRQVRVPRWSDLRDADKENLASRDFDKACDVAARVFRMGDALLRRCTAAL